MSINPVFQNPVNPLPAQERSVSEPKATAVEHNEPQDMIDVAKSLSSDIQHFLSEVQSNGVPVTSLSEGEARDAAEAARDALGALSLSIANANPGALTGFLSDAE